VTRRSAGYTVLEHTADAGIEARGRDLGELMANAALGMYSLVVDLAAVRPERRRRIEVAAEGPEQLLVAWLSELLFITETEDLVFSRFDVRECSPGRLRADAWGESFDPERHPVGGQVKGVTRHQLRVERDAEGWRARVILDM
jgi:SHS2 domain-containing protein